MRGRQARQIRYREKRPSWVDDLLAVKTEWIMYDSQTQKLKTMYAEDQKDAIKRAISNGVIPRRTQDIVPRTGGHVKTIMKPDEFREFMERISAE